MAQAQYILTQSQNPKIALKFYESVKTEVNKLSFLADVYRFKRHKELIIAKYYKVKFLVAKDTVYIVQFKFTRQN